MEEKLFIKNSKGLKLALVINGPDKSRKYPAVIILHGFTGYKEEEHLDGLAKTLAKNEFVAVRFDCSGSGDSDGSFEKDYSMSNYLTDIGSVYEYLRKLEFVDEHRMGIAGHSMGGLLSIVFASQNPKIKICVAISSPTILDRANWVAGIMERWRETGWFEKVLSRDGSTIRVPYSFHLDAIKYNALDFVGNVKCPFLTVLGTIDDVVYPGDSREIFELANEPKELAEIEGAGHDYKKNSKLVGMVSEKILAFLKKYL
jgi:uncharacterized protein